MVTTDASQTGPETRGFWHYAPLVCAVLFAAAAPWSIAAAESSIILGAVVVLAGVLAGKLRYRALPATFWFIILFVVAQAVSIPFGVHPARSLRCFRGSWYFLFPFVFWGLLAAPSIRRTSLRVLAVSGGLAGLYGIVQHWSGVEWVHGKALEPFGGGGFIATGTLGHHLTYAGAILPLLFLAIGLACDLRPRLLWVGAAASLLGGLVFSFARTAWIGAVAGALALGGMRGRRIFLLAIGALVLLGGLAVLIEPSVATRALSVLQIEDDPRMRLWETALRITRDHPLTGAGLGSYKTQFPIYKVPGTYMATGNPHCDPLNVLVETGLLGLTLWLGMWAAFFVETRPRRTSRLVPAKAPAPVPVPAPLPATAPANGNTRPWLADAIRAGVVALLIGGLGQVFSSDEEVAEIWWFLVVAALWETRDPYRSTTTTFSVRAARTGAPSTRR